MASHNSNHRTESHPRPNQRQGSRQEQHAGKYPLISILLNSALYFIECVFITKHSDSYRLVAIHYGRVLCDRQYPTLRGCRISFDKMFRHKSWNKLIKATWSSFYDPDTSWWEEKCNYLEAGDMVQTHG